MLQIASRLLSSFMGAADAAALAPAPEVDVSLTHRKTGRALGQLPAGFEVAVFGMGCFWGAEKLFWDLPGVWSTAVGYAGGHMSSPTYEQVCSGCSGHAEVVRIVFDPTLIDYERLLEVFWEHHDPTQDNRQGNDIGSQYRSLIVSGSDEQWSLARQSRDTYQGRLSSAGHGPIRTQLLPSPVPFFFAEPEHQQYLIQHPQGYCPHHGTGVDYPGIEIEPLSLA